MVFIYYTIVKLLSDNRLKNETPKRKAGWMHAFLSHTYYGGLGSLNIGGLA